MSLLRLVRGASAARASARALQLLPSSAAGSPPTPVAAAATARGFCTSGEKGYSSTIDFESPEGHEFEQVVDVGLSDVSYAAFVNRQSVAKYVWCTALPLLMVGQAVRHRTCLPLQN